MVKWNGQMTDLNGFTDFSLDNYRELYGNTIFSLDPSSEIANLFNKCLKEIKSVDSICKVKSKKGEIRWLQVFITPQLNIEGKIEEIIAVEIDITQFKKQGRGIACPEYEDERNHP